MILSYANGPGFETHLSAENNYSHDTLRLNLTGKEDWYTSYSFQNPSSVPIASESHGGDDVAIFAIGPYAHLFHSVHEQSYIAHAVEFAAGWHENISSGHNRQNDIHTDLFRFMFLVQFYYLL